jgi:hypothetical protein
MNGEMCCPRCQATVALVDSQEGRKLTAVAPHHDPLQLVLPGFAEPLGAESPLHAAMATLADRVAAAQPDLFSPGESTAKSPESARGSTPPESLKSGEYELLRRPVSLADLEANLPRRERRPASEVPPPPARPRTVPPPMPRTRPPSIAPSLAAPLVPQFAPAEVNEESRPSVPVASAKPASSQAASRRRWMTYGAASVAAAAALVLSVNLLPHVSGGPRSAAIAEVPRAEAAEATATAQRSASIPASPAVAAAEVTPVAETEAPAEVPPTQAPAVVAPPASEAKAAGVAPSKNDEPAHDEADKDAPARAAAANDTPAPAQSANAPTEQDEEEALPEFDKEAASSALDEGIAGLAACSQREVGAGTTRVAVTFAPSGRVTTALLEGPGPFAGTPVAGCIVSRLRGVQVPAFSGEKVTVHRTVTLP